MLRVPSLIVDGIQPLLQLTITTFLKAKSNSDRMRTTSPGSSAASPLLRIYLERWKYFQIIFLEEVKIARRDVKTQQSVPQAVKPAPTIDARATEPGYGVYLSLQRQKQTGNEFGGEICSVCTLARRDLLVSQEGEPENVRKVACDLEGHVLVLALPRIEPLVLHLYAVNGAVNRTNNPYRNPYRNPHTGKAIGTGHDDNEKLHRGLKSDCEVYSGL